MPNVSVPIIDELVHPNLDQLQETDEGVHTGPLDLTLNVPNTLGNIAYGVRLSVITLPAHWGKKLGNPDILIPPVGQFALSQPLGDGNTVVTQVVTMDYDGKLVTWDNDVPPIGISPQLQLLVHVEPGVTIHLRWLTVH